ncbi:sulfite exporter TauE/SafE family protein [Hoeflea sp.]|uniref:sulfite exporter TauE/SafE family protein n=1 Tax=Hoeflea sp. TaxID=1940281 RepID=UPI003A904AF8
MFLGDFPLADQPWLILAVFLIVMAASVVQAGLGMGFGLTAAPLLALIDPHLVPVPTLIIGMVTASMGGWRERGSIIWPEVGIGIAGRLAGVVCGALVLSQLEDRKAFMLVFGIMVAIAVILSLSGWRWAFSRFSLVSMGWLSGLMGTITSVGAPPLALIYQDRKPGEARPTLSAFFALGCAASLAGLALSGWAHAGDIYLALAMVPPMLVGIWVARRIGGRLDSRFRPALMAISGAAAVMLIVRGVM